MAKAGEERRAGGSRLACPTCMRLWREYQDATRRHIRIHEELRTAAVEQNYPRIEVLTKVLETAAELRDGAWKAVRRHESTVHAAGSAGERDPVLPPFKNA